MVSDCNYKMSQEVDDPWQLDMSELCLSEGFSRNMQGNGAGEITNDTFISHLVPPFLINYLACFMMPCVRASANLMFSFGD